MKVTELDSKGWVMYVTNGWKVHFCPVSLLAGLMEDASYRGHGDGDFEPAIKGFVDLPGMIMSDRTYQEFKVGDFTVKIPTEDLEHYYQELIDSPERKFSNGRRYHKIHGWMHCIVFTLGQRTTALKEMRKLLPQVKKKAREEKAEFKRRMKQIREDGTQIFSLKDPDSIPKIQLSGKKNNEKN